jgi:hypothetical protein
MRNGTASAWFGDRDRRSRVHAALAAVCVGALAALRGPYIRRVDIPVVTRIRKRRGVERGRVSEQTITVFMEVDHGGI